MYGGDSASRNIGGAAPSGAILAERGSARKSARPFHASVSLDEASPSSSAGLAAMRYDSVAHAPRSVMRQRSLQNGRQRFEGANTVALPHAGQARIRPESVESVTGCRRRARRERRDRIPACAAPPPEGGSAR